MVRELEAKLGEGKAVRAKSQPRASVDKTAATQAVLAVLAGRNFTTAQALSELVGFDGSILKGAIQTLVSEGKLVRAGVARGSKYKIA